MATKTRQEKRAARQNMPTAQQLRQEKRQARQDNRNFRVPGFGTTKDLVNASREEDSRVTKEQQNMNNIAEYNPYGSSEFIRDENGNITGRKTSLSENQQAILTGGENQELGFQQGVSGAMGQYNQAPGLRFQSLASADPRYTEVPNDAGRQRYEQAYFDRGSKLLNKQFDKAGEAETANLRARGMQFGGTDYNQQYKERVTDPRNEAMSNLAQDAVIRGGQEQVNQFGMQLQANNQNFGQGMQSRNQGIQEQLTMRNQPLQEAATLRSMQQGVTNPTFNPYQAAQMNGAPVAQIGMQMAGMANDRFMQNDSQKFQASLPRGGGGGGGMGFNDWAQRQLFANMLQQENMMMQQQMAGGGQQAPSPWGMAMSGIAGGIGQGIGNWAAGAF